MTRRTWLIGAAALAVRARRPAASTVELAVSGREFRIAGRPAFLLGVSYFGALGAPERILRSDLAEMKRRGFNWLRVWATWEAFGADASAVDGEGRPREPYLSRLKSLVGRLNALGMIADVTLSRGMSANGSPRLLTHDAHHRAVETVLAALKPLRNWYLDLANERSVRDKRFASFEELKDLQRLVRERDPARLVTASHGGDVDLADLRAYLLDVEVDFLTPHRPRDPSSPEQTEAKTRAYLASMAMLGHVIPVHYQEPFRRGYATWQPLATDYATDLAGARAGGAAGWCFHNGDQRDRPDGQPRRSFDLREHSLFQQLDDEERGALASIR